MLDAEVPASGSGSVRRTIQSFEENLKSRSAAFEAERLKATKPAQQDAESNVPDPVPPPPAASHEQKKAIAEVTVYQEGTEELEESEMPVGKGKVVAKNKAANRQQVVPYNETVEGNELDDLEAPEVPRGKGKALAARKAAGGKSKPCFDPYTGMYYDPYGFSAMGKNQMVPVKDDWADAVDDESEWWYSGVKLDVCCKGSLNLRVRAWFRFRLGPCWSCSAVWPVGLLSLVFLFAVFFWSLGCLACGSSYMGLSAQLNPGMRTGMPGLLVKVCPLHTASRAVVITRCISRIGSRSGWLLRANRQVLRGSVVWLLAALPFPFFVGSLSALVSRGEVCGLSRSLVFP